MLPDLTTVDQTDSHKLRLENYRLVIKNTSIADSGLYHCFVRTDTNVDIVTYRLTVSHETLFMNAGRNIYVDCTAKGEPFPLIKWVLPDGSQMTPTQFIGSRIFIFPNGTLYIKNINPNDSGRYECSATNPVGFAKRTVQMDVRQEAPGPWKGLYQQHSVMATYGSTVFLHCPESLGRFQVHRNGTLELRGIRKTDEGRFLCIAKNYLGEASLAVDLEVASLAENTLHCQGVSPHPHQCASSTWIMRRQP
uniref:Ig-like domain-containing protein n=1 Tax=Sinocyclocheilus grahami TaxID=75366 RepID=A0A672QGM0_SINGR